MINITEAPFEKLGYVFQESINKSLGELIALIHEGDYDGEKAIVNIKVTIEVEEVDNEINGKTEYMPKIKFDCKSKIPQERKISGEIETFGYVVSVGENLGDVVFKKQTKAQVSVFDEETEDEEKLWKV